MELYKCKCCDKYSEINNPNILNNYSIICNFHNLPWDKTHPEVNKNEDGFYYVIDCPKEKP